jgi:hypothetical protein
LAWLPVPVQREAERLLANTDPLVQLLIPTAVAWLSRWRAGVCSGSKNIT